MKRNSLKKYSVLGLVLLAASAVTAAVMPSKASDKETVVNGTITDQNGSAATFTNCTFTNASVVKNCYTSNFNETGGGTHLTTVAG